MGDGEIQEGQVWEAAMTSSHYKLDNVIALLDNNNLQIDGFNDDVKTVKPLKDKWEAFGWHVIESDGHDMAQIVEALEASRKVQGKPTMIVANTVKGKGVSFMENNPVWHGTAPNDDQAEQAYAEIRAALEAL